VRASSLSSIQLPQPQFNQQSQHQTPLVILVTDLYIHRWRCCQQTKLY